MAIEMKEWSKETKRNVILSTLVILAAIVLFSVI